MSNILDLFNYAPPVEVPQGNPTDRKVKVIFTALANLSTDVTVGATANPTYSSIVQAAVNKIGANVEVQKVKITTNLNPNPEAPSNTTLDVDVDVIYVGAGDAKGNV